MANEKVYGIWRGGWLHRSDGAVIHSPYPQVVMAEKGDQQGDVREMLPDCSPGDDYSKAVRPQSDKMVRARDDK